MATWMRGADAELNLATITGGCFPDEVTAYITCLYGPRNPVEVRPGVFTGWVDAATGLRVDYHYGLDLWPLGFGDGSGCPLLALGYGTVSRTLTLDRSFGNMTEVKYVVDGHSYRVQYLHMRDVPSFAVGEAVVPGQVLGVVGSTGASSGAHLHLAVYYDDAIQDPLPFLIAAQPTGFVPDAPPPPPVESVYPIPDVQWVAAGWGAVGDAPWAHTYPLRAQTVRPGANIQLLRAGRSPDGWEEFRLRIEDYEGE